GSRGAHEFALSRISRGNGSMEQLLFIPHVKSAVSTIVLSEVVAAYHAIYDDRCRDIPKRPSGSNRTSLTNLNRAKAERA
ncbi:MAG TPA: hypothetical protein VEI25_18220, partial [Paraburkholderia sp.]|nr:hypothetical protein [Paraburkholderia sp.]